MCFTVKLCIIWTVGSGVARLFIANLRFANFTTKSQAWFHFIPITRIANVLCSPTMSMNFQMLAAPLIHSIKFNKIAIWILNQGQNALKVRHRMHYYCLFLVSFRFHYWIDGLLPNHLFNVLDIYFPIDARRVDI